MSMYHMMNGVNQCTFFIAPLVVGHPQDNVGRFRDCFISETNKIEIFTRLGGGNREYHEKDIEHLRSLPGFITDYDDDEDGTYATFLYEIPEEFKEDVQKLIDGKFMETSEKYQRKIIETFPKIEDHIKYLFNNKK